MKIDLTLKWMLPAVFLLVILFSCTTDQRELSDEALHLIWVKTSAEDTPEKARLGLIWALSATGATLKEADAIQIKGNHILVEPSALGYSSQALKHLRTLHQKIKQTEEYQRRGGFDVGRYVCLLIGSSEHYYALTGQVMEVEEILKQYHLQSRKAYINHSCVSHVDRLMRFSQQTKTYKQLYLTIEIDPKTHDTLEYETLELMPNGQLRFGIFDAQGRRLNAAEEAVTGAGKPAKCMWCHESQVKPTYNKQIPVKGYLGYAELQQMLQKDNETFQAMKDERSETALPDYTEHMDHAFTELLYISFMEPSAERLSQEWGMSVNEVKKHLAGLPTHVHHEFKQLGRLYQRADVEQRAPYHSLAISASVREQLGSEVNHMK